MKKLVVLFGCTMALMIGMVSQIEVKAQMTATSPVCMPVTNMVGTWTGTMNTVSAQSGYALNVPVALTVSDQQTDSAGNTYFRGSVTIGPPFGTGKPSPIAAATQMNMTNKLMQTVEVMWAGVGIQGCGQGTSVVMPSGNMLMIHGCFHVPAGGGSSGPVAASAPAMAIFDLTQQ